MISITDLCRDSDYEKHEKLGQRMATEGEFWFCRCRITKFQTARITSKFAAGLLTYNHPVTYAVIMILFSFRCSDIRLFSFEIRKILFHYFLLLICISPEHAFHGFWIQTLSFPLFSDTVFIMLKNYSGKLYQIILIGLFLLQLKCT